MAITSRIFDAPVQFTRALSAALGVSPSVVARLTNPCAIDASPVITPAVAAVLTNPQALAAAVGVSPSVVATLKNPQALSAALGVSPSVAATLTLPTPLNLASGCVAWFDMLDSSSFTNASGAVSAIVNKASGVSWTEALASQRPTYNATGLNGKPCMDFDGVNDRIISTEAAVWQALNVGNAYTLFYVAAFDTLARDDSVIATGNSATNLGIRVWGQNTTGAGRWAAITLTDAGGVVTTVSAASSQLGAHVHCWHASATQVSLQLDGGAADPNNAAHAPGATTSDRVALGCRPRSAPTLFLDGKLGSLLLYNSRLSAGEITSISSYLAARWA